MTIKPMFEERARERMQERKGEQAGATKANLPYLEKSKSRDQAAAAVGVSGRTSALSENFFRQFKPSNHLAQVTRQNVLPFMAWDRERLLPARYIRVIYHIMAALTAVRVKLKPWIMLAQNALKIMMFLRLGHRQALGALIQRDTPDRWRAGLLQP